MDTKVKIPFADQNGKIVHISQVENGLACNCKCCKCRSQLVAKNDVRNIKEAHFAHYNSTDCEKSLETSIHEAAKQLILQTKKIVVPDILYYDRSKEIQFEKVELEKTLPYDFRPDALGYINNVDKVIIEFAVTHFVDSKKKQKINKLKIPTIEVSLNRSCFSFDDIEKVLIGSGYKKWIYYSMQDIPEINSFVQSFESQLSTLKTNIDLLTDENLSLLNENLSLKKKNENLIIENVKLQRNRKGYKS